MPFIDLAVLLSTGLGTFACGLFLWRHGLRGRRLAALTYLAFSGVVLIASMTAHCLDVLSRLVVGQHYDGTVAVYDFRVYALLLLGTLLISQGAQLLRAVVGLSHGRGGSRQKGLRATLLALVYVLPLIPIQVFFALPLSVIGVVNLLVLARIGEQVFPEPQRAPVPPPATPEAVEV